MNNNEKNDFTELNDEFIISASEAKKSNNSEIVDKDISYTNCMNDELKNKINLDKKRLSNFSPHEIINDEFEKAKIIFSNEANTILDNAIVTLNKNNAPQIKLKNDMKQNQKNKKNDESFLYNNLQLSEIKEIAKAKKIKLTQDGKPKTKKDLINELKSIN